MEALNKLAQVTNPALSDEIRDLSGVGFLDNFLPRIIGVGFIIGILLFVIYMIFGAISWITSGGDKAAVETARNKITYAIIGLVVLFSLYAVVKVLQEFFGISILELDFGPLQIGTTSP